MNKRIGIIAVSVALFILALALIINFNKIEDSLFGGKSLRLSSQDAVIFQARQENLRGKTPDQVIDAYMKSLIGESDVSTFVFAVDGFVTETGDQNYHIIDGYEIASLDRSSTTASFTVDYENIADVLPDGRAISHREKESVDFSLVKRDGFWLVSKGLIGRFVREGKPGAQIFEQSVYYYKSSNDDSVEVKVSQVRDPLNPINVYYKIMRHLFYTPEIKPKGLRTYIPGDGILLGVGRYGDFLHVNVDKNFDAGLKSDEDLKKAITQITLTADAIQEIEGVKFFLDNESYDRLADIGIDPAKYIGADQFAPKPPPAPKPASSDTSSDIFASLDATGSSSDTASTDALANLSH